MQAFWGKRGRRKYLQNLIKINAVFEGRSVIFIFNKVYLCECIEDLAFQSVIFHSRRRSPGDEHYVVSCVQLLPVLSENFPYASLNSVSQIHFAHFSRCDNARP